MSTDIRKPWNASARPRGFTLVEMVISIMLVGVMLVAALNTVGASKLGQRRTSDRRRGRQLAEELMSEILQQDYADASSGPDSFGPSGSEAATGDRSLFDDVDDYDGWSACPPQRKDGTVMKNLPGWARAVTVKWVSPSDISQTVDRNQQAKRITVVVSHDKVPVAELMAIRTSDPPALEACCLSDGSCLDLIADVCTALGGEPQGPESNCYNTGCSAGLEGTFRDEFNATEYSGNDGTLSWAGDWREINESDGPRRGDEQVVPDPLASPPPPSNQLRVRNNDGGGEGVLREADLTGALSATLSLLYRRAALDDADDYVAVEVSTDGAAGPWTEIVRFQGPANESAYQPFSQDISAYVSGNFAIRFISSPDLGNRDDVWFDEVEIKCGP